MELLCGIDEAGRGPLAGPVIAAAVVLPSDFPAEVLGDSKKLSEKKRAAAEKIIKENACWGIGECDHETIDKINILQASLLAMSRAYGELTAKLPEWAKAHGLSGYSVSAIVDGNKLPSIPCPCIAEPKADGKYPPVMAASIIAKTCRDRLMLEYDKLFPQYGYARHKGYPTAEHRRICRELGDSPIQRLSFKY